MFVFGCVRCGLDRVPASLPAPTNSTLALIGRLTAYLILVTQSNELCVMVNKGQIVLYLKAHFQGDAIVIIGNTNSSSHLFFDK